ncbi:aquaporin Z [Paraburkholderia rhizosphaerae]|uniref:Aquaporin Z n=1 Tax=Paraburkholderia rhizosphaerae TaxID=480658 RepID=A0A4V3HFJ2_9BURK|nr:aquaporin Z [Paraburkholderia rhizosphaerae]TDY53405.1 aquaporin Z [Paraburkholderia rhizosphaerae]
MASLGKRLVVEGAGTAWVMFIGCGSAVLNAGAVQQGWGVLEVPFAFGLALTTAMAVLGRVSGAHFNPAVTIGFATAQRFPVRDLLPYIAAQLIGALMGAALLAYVASGRPGFYLSSSAFGANGYDDHSPSDYRLHAALAIEFAMSFVFVFVNLAMSARKASTPLAPFVIGGCLALIYLIATPVTNASVNPARSTAAALFVGDWALDQLWLFWAAPMAGGLLAGLAYPLLCSEANNEVHSRGAAGEPQDFR